MYKTVIFDLDGTLLDTLEDIHDAVNLTLSKFGYETNTLKQTRSYVGNGLKKLIERSLPKGTAEEIIEKVFIDMRDYYTEHCQIKTKPYDGMLDLLKRLYDAGYQMAIVSNKNDAAVKELNSIYFSEYIKVAIGEKEGISKKPAPDTVYEAIKELGAEKRFCVYVGDSEVDVATAKNAGLDCIAVDWGFRDRELLESLGPKYLISNPTEIDSIINSEL